MDDSGWQIPEAEILDLTPRATKYCVCIPVLDEGERIRNQLRRMRQVPGIPDIVVADGGSHDGATDPEFLKRQGVRALLVKRGPGRVGAQLRIAFAFCLRQGYAGIVTIDGNGKDGVDVIPRFIDALEHGYDYVQGSRFGSGGRSINTPWSRYVAIRLIHAPVLSVAARHRYSDTSNGFRGYSRRLLLHPDVQPFRDVFQNYELLWYLTARAPRTGHAVREIGIIRQYPPSGAIPTKIAPVSGAWQMLGELWGVLSGRFNPAPQVSDAAAHPSRTVR